MPLELQAFKPAGKINLLSKKQIDPDDSRKKLKANGGRQYGVYMLQTLPLGFQ